MPKIKIYAATYRKEYRRALLFLNSRGDVESLEYLGTLPIYYTLAKLNNNVKFFRKIRRFFTGKDTVYKYERSLKEIIQSYFAPITLIFTNDLIITTMLPYSIRISYLLFLKKIGKKVIFSSSWPYWNYEKYLVRPNFITKRLWESFLSGTIAHTTTSYAKGAMEEKGANAFWIPHCVDTEVFKPGASKEPNDSTMRILYAGRLVEEKGIRGLLRVAEKLKDLDVEFLFAGEGSLDVLVQNAEEHLKVRHLGYIDNEEELIKAYNNADIFVLNSYETEKWEELFGIALIDAMSCGLPVVATDCIGPKEIVKDGVNGFLIPQKNDGALLEKLTTLINNPNLIKKMGEQGRKQTIELYDIRKISKKWASLLSQFH